jgi:hypothetical protein
MQNQGQMGGPGPSKMQNQSSLVPGSNPPRSIKHEVCQKK